MLAITCSCEVGGRGEAGDLPFLDTDGSVVIGQQRVVRLARAAGEAELRLREGFRPPN